MFPFPSKLPTSVPGTEPKAERCQRSAARQLLFTSLIFRSHRRRLSPSQSEATLWGAEGGLAEMCTPGHCGQCLKAPGICLQCMITRCGRGESKHGEGWKDNCSRVSQSQDCPMLRFQDAICYFLLLMVYPGSTHHATGNRATCRT